MDAIKRHAWLLATIAAMVVLSAVGLYLWFAMGAKAEARTQVLVSSRSALQGLEPLYNKDAVEKVSTAISYREDQLEEITDYLSFRGQWQVLVPGIFPVYRSTSQVFGFFDAYQAELRRFMTVLDAVDPVENPAAALTKTVFASAGVFYTDPWMQQAEQDGLPPRDMTIENLRRDQNALWLMEDIVLAIRRTNSTYFENADIPENQRNVTHAVVKELHEISLGEQAATIPDSVGVQSSRSRTGQWYREVEAQRTGRRGGPGAIGGETEGTPEVEGRASGTLTGRASNNNGGRYKVLPFRLVVICDAGNFAELIRQLEGTRSMMTVGQVRYLVIPETESSYGQFNLMVPDVQSRVQIYGERPLAQLVIIGESLVFQHRGARPTLPPQQPEQDQQGNQES